ncbi:MAG: hypothetical protein CBC71_01175 [Rhodobacteraceae bacterium TMED111]|nr:MAG: hypothetical protein CBC71_01175 [Rhodobacteraceae bacterium TMED111]|tara:strand:- start:21986 stop:22183 length:198 start_codon:yes stop_codon:yes gene_type:complete
MGKTKDLYMEIEGKAIDCLDDYLNDKDLNLPECRYNFEAEHGCGAMHIFDEIFEGAEILKLNGHK